MDWSQLELPGTNSALGPYGAALGYAPGVQAWYNLWIEADPTATDAATPAPTRGAFGLEEDWEHAIFGEPQNRVRAAPTPRRAIDPFWDARAFSLLGYQYNSIGAPLSDLATHPSH